MKKLTPVFLALIVLFIGLSSFTRTHHKTVAGPAGNGQDSTKHHPKDKKHPNVGGSTWSIQFTVGDLAGKPISNAKVDLPCSGSPAKPTNASGIAIFTGNAPCPCSEGKATISTTKGCSQAVIVSCDSSYIVNCNQ